MLYALDLTALVRTSMGKFPALLLSALTLVGCMSTSSSPTSTMLSENTALVSSLGGGPADRDKVYAVALAEAARLARARGYQYFTILRADDRSVTIPKYMLGQNIPYDFTARGSGRAFGSTNLSPANMGGATFMAPGKAVPYLKPGLEITVKMYRRGEIDSRQDGVWNIDFIPNEAGIEP
jgi:hypothetical protein